jgi:hypothetical protein
LPAEAPSGSSGDAIEPAEEAPTRILVPTLHTAPAHTVPVQPSLPPMPPMPEEPPDFFDETLSAPPAEPPAAPPVVYPPTRKPAGADGGTDRPASIPGYLAPPPVNERDSGDRRILMVVLRSSGDKTRDVLRLRRIHGIIISYPGEDSFAMQVFEQNRYFLLEFPNFTCGVCQEMLDRLAPLVGPDNLRVEKVTFQ